MLTVERFYNEKENVVGGYHEDKQAFVFKRAGTELYSGRRAYLLDSWLFRIWLGCNIGVKDIYIKDSGNNEKHRMSVKAMLEKGQLIEGGEAGKDFAVFVDDMVPKTETKATVMPRTGTPKNIEIFECLED